MISIRSLLRCSLVRVAPAISVVLGTSGAAAREDVTCANVDSVDAMTVGDRQFVSTAYAGNTFLRAERWCDRPAIAPVLQLRTAFGLSDSNDAGSDVAGALDVTALLGVRIMDFGDLRFGPSLMSLHELGHTSTVISGEIQFANYTSALWNNVNTFGIGYDLQRHRGTVDYTFMSLDKFIGDSKTWQLAPFTRVMFDGGDCVGTIGVALIAGSFGHTSGR